MVQFLLATRIAAVSCMLFILFGYNARLNQQLGSISASDRHRQKIEFMPYVRVLSCASPHLGGLNVLKGDDLFLLQEHKHEKIFDRKRAELLIIMFCIMHEF